MRDEYDSFAALAASETAGTDYDIVCMMRHAGAQ